MDVWTVSPTVLAPLRAAAHKHPLTVRPLPRPSICGLVLDPALRACLPAIQQHTPMPCARGGRRQTWFDSSTSHAPTAWVTAFPSRTAACVPTGRAVASMLQVALLRYARLLRLHLTLHCTLDFRRPSCQSRRKLLAACSERLAHPSCVCDAATATTIHVTCQYHASAWVRKGFRSGFCQKYALSLYDLHADAFGCRHQYVLYSRREALRSVRESPQKSHYQPLAGTYKLALITETSCAVF